MRSIFYSILLHATVVGLMVVNVDLGKKTAPRPVVHVDIVKTVKIDNKQIEKELQRLIDIDNEKIKKQKDLEKKLKNVQKKAAQSEKKRKAEEKKLADIKRKKSQAQQKLAKLKKDKEELDRKHKLEQDKRRKAEKLREKAAAETKRKTEEQRKKAEAEKRRSAELALQKEMEAELKAEQLSRDQTLLNKIISDIYERVTSNFNRTGLPQGLSCTLSVRLIPGGEVVNVSIAKSSGNELFDRRAITAVQKSSPFPVPSEVETFERLKLRENTLPFTPED